jgi:hypothetical protein
MKDSMTVLATTTFVVREEVVELSKQCSYAS